MDIDPPKALSAEALSIFSEGIGLILSQWWALQMAIENEWGGRDSRLKADQIASDIVSWFTHSKGITFIYLFYFFFFFVSFVLVAGYLVELTKWVFVFLHRN
jgi:hypothetical protein